MARFVSFGRARGNGGCKGSMEIRKKQSWDRCIIGVCKIMLSIREYVIGRANGIYHKIPQEHKQIVRGVFTVAFFALVGKSIGMAKEMAIAWRYGIDATVDAYVFVLNIAAWPVTLLYGVFQAVLIPLAAQIRHQSPQELSRFRQELFGVTLVVGIVMGMIGWIGLPWLVQQSWIGLTPTQQALARQFAPWFAWIIPFGIVYALQAVWVMSENRHVNTLLDSLPALALFLSVLTMGGASALIVGVLIGFVLQPLFISLSLFRHQGFDPPLWGFRSPWWASFWSAFLVMLGGQFLQSVTSLADQFFAARLGVGELATLSYSNRILALLMSLGAMAIGRALLPVLSRIHAQGKPIRRISIGWALLFLLLGGLVAGIGYCFATDLVRFAFQRGAFDLEDTRRVAEVWRLAVWQLPVYFGSIVLVYAVLSERKPDLVVWVAGSNFILKLILLWLFVIVFGWGIGGVIISGIMIYVNSLLLMLVIIFWR